MKNTYHYLAIFYLVFIISNSTFAQQNFEKCGFNQLIEYQNQKTPGYKEQINAIYKNLVAKANKREGINNKTIYTIPVVFHVVWNSSDPNQNLDDSVLIEQIAVLNEDYSRTNADTTNTRPEFLPIVGNAQIQFKLACKDTNGNFTNGIIRVQTDTVFGGGFLPDMASISKIQRTAQGGSDPWRPSEYLNIWVGDVNGGSSTPSLLGVATPPPGLPNWPAGSTPAELRDGAIIQWNAFGRNNPFAISAAVINGRTVTHEVGHYLGVRHTAENTFGGIFGSICGDDDGLNDTPTCDQSQQGCDLSRNSCMDTIPGTTGDLPDMVENYMDYSDQDCQNSFTVGQTLIMQDVIQNYRSGLINSPGLANCATGIEEETTKNNLTLYPNPSTGVVNIDLKDKFNYTIFNSLGQQITPQAISETQFKIQQTGVYFIKIETVNNTYTERIIIQ